MMGSYDDGEDVPTPGDGFEAEHAEVIEAIRSIHDPATRRAVFAVFVLAVLRGRISR